MDKMLELIDSIKQNIPDQKYIELMQALAEVKGRIALGGSSLA